MNGLGRMPKTGAQAKQGERSAGIVQIQGVARGAYLEYVTLAATRKNLSGTDFRASPEGVRRRDASNNLRKKTNKMG
jgi:hypothetical protein